MTIRSFIKLLKFFRKIKVEHNLRLFFIRSVIAKSLVCVIISIILYKPKGMGSNFGIIEFGAVWTKMATVMVIPARK